jgi:exodeoxyribonuclease VII small subunit
MQKKKTTYKQALTELESIVEKIENQSPDVDELTDLVKRAVELVKYCKDKLRKTEDDLNRSLEEMD